MPEGLKGLMPVAAAAAEEEDEEQAAAAEEAETEGQDGGDDQASDAQDPEDDEEEMASEDSGSEAAATRAQERLANALLESPDTPAATRIAELSRGAERTRITAIVTAPEAKGREAAAQRLALSGLDVAAARGVLGELPKSGGLDARMASERQPDLGPGGKASQASPITGLAAAVDDINARHGAARR